MVNKVKISKLPLENIDWEPIVTVLGEANRQLARFDGTLRGIPSPQVLLSPLTTREAVLSSRIEGTQASLGEVLEFEAEQGKSDQEPETEREKDIQEIINYRRAMDHAVEELENRPISLNLIKRLHFILLDSVRGQNKARGEFRKEQNWFGPPGCSIEEATYIPPDWQKAHELMENLEKYIHEDDKDVLVQLAVVHAQFELIHPFWDGNGRVGRMLVPLHLYEKGILSRPMFYVSAYLEANREEYYDRLLNISEKGDWSGWIKFFLSAVREQANENTGKAQEVISLYDAMKTKIVDLTGSKYSIQILDAIFSHPFFTTPLIVQWSGVPKSSVSRIFKTLRENGVLETVREGKGRSPTIMTFPELIEIIEN